MTNQIQNIVPTIESLCIAIQLIEILLYQICNSGEKGLVNCLVQTTALKLFNFMVEQQFLTVDDSNHRDITDRYFGNMGQRASNYGIKLLDAGCSLQKVAPRKIVAHDGYHPISLDKLTVNGTEYLQSQVLLNKHNCLEYEQISFSNALCQLKDHFCKLITELKSLDCGC